MKRTSGVIVTPQKIEELVRDYNITVVGMNRLDLRIGVAGHRPTLRRDLQWRIGKPGQPYHAMPQVPFFKSRELYWYLMGLCEGINKRNS